MAKEKNPKNIFSVVSYPIEKNKIIKNTLATLFSLLSTLGLSAILFWAIFISIIKAFLAIFLVLFGLTILLVYFYFYLHYKRYYYELDREFLVIKEGVITYGETTIPYYRIQDVYVDQDPLDQLFGLYDLHVATASGQSNINAHIDGLSYENAQIIKSEILKRLKTKK
ncbi:MAG: PH domain-containing protein [Candidatus Anstonellaceae archaeon]